VPHDGLFTLKGQCHEMNNFFEGLKNQISTYFLYRCRRFLNFCIFNFRTVLFKFLHASLKTLINSWIFYQKPLQNCVDFSFFLNTHSLRPHLVALRSRKYFFAAPAPAPNIFAAFGLPFFITASFIRYLEN
jgi:hypothetical protein